MLLMHEALPYATNIVGLKLLMHEALRTTVSTSARVCS
jgi:hypothetical protein